MNTVFVSNLERIKFGGWKMHRVPVVSIMTQIHAMFEEHGLPATDTEILDVASDIKKHLGGIRLREIPAVSNYALVFLKSPRDITYGVFREWLMEYDRIFSGYPAWAIWEAAKEHLMSDLGQLPPTTDPSMPKGYAAWLDHVGHAKPEDVMAGRA